MKQNEKTAFIHSLEIVDWSEDQGAEMLDAIKTYDDKIIEDCIKKYEISLYSYIMDRLIVWESAFSFATSNSGNIAQDLAKADFKCVRS